MSNGINKVLSNPEQFTLYKQIVQFRQDNVEVFPIESDHFIRNYYMSMTNDQISSALAAQSEMNEFMMFLTDDDIIHPYEIIDTLVYVDFIHQAKIEEKEALQQWPMMKETLFNRETYVIDPSPHFVSKVDHVPMCPMEDCGNCQGHSCDMVVWDEYGEFDFE